MAIEGPNGGVALEAVWSSVTEPGQAPIAYEVLTECPTFVASWANDLMDSEAVLQLLAIPHLLRRPTAATKVVP